MTAHLAAGHLVEARRLGSQVLEIADDLNIGTSRAFARHLLAPLCRAEADAANAKAIAYEALDVASSSGNYAENR